MVMGSAKEKKEKYNTIKNNVYSHLTNLTNISLKERNIVQNNFQTCIIFVGYTLYFK